MDKYVVDCSTGEATVVALTSEEVDQLEADRAAWAAEEAAPKPLDPLGVAYTYDVVIGVREIGDAAGALCLPEQALVDEATAWALAAT